MSEAPLLPISKVLSWNLDPAEETAATLLRTAGEIEAEIEASARAVGDSQSYFDSGAGDAARQRAQDDRKDALTTVDLYKSMSATISRTTALFRGEINLIRGLIQSVADSEWDLFYTDDGEVMSRKSNWEWMKEKWWAPGRAIASKERTEFELTSDLRDALDRIQETDLESEAAIQGLLEQVPNSARAALIAEPTDPTLAKILKDYQTDATKETVLWPSGWLLDMVRAWDPTFEVTALPREEADALQQLISREGVHALKDFYDIKTQAEEAAAEQHSSLDVKSQEKALSDGHGDAFRHAYWNALMTQRFGEEWTQTYTTAHEKTGGNPPAREAMDLYNNELGRAIARENPDAGDTQLQAKIAESIRDGKAIVLTAPTEQDTPQISWSNSVRPGDTKIQSGVSVPLPGKR